MAEGGHRYIDVVNDIVRDDTKLLKSMSELLNQEMNNIDKLRVQRYSAEEDLKESKDRRMDLQSDSVLELEIQEKADILCVIEGAILRRQHYAQMLKELIHDRRINIQSLSNECMGEMQSKMAHFSIS